MCSKVLKHFFFHSPGGPTLQVALNGGDTLLSMCWLPWTVRTHRGALKGSKQLMLVPFHVNAIKHERWTRAVPVEHSREGNLIRQLEKKLWGHLSASAWFHLYSCYFSWFCTKAARTPEVVSIKNTSVTQFTSPAPGHTQHTWLMAPGPHASCAWHQGFLSKLSFEQEQKKPHVCHNPSRGRHLKSETLSVEWQLRYDMMRYRNARVMMLLTHLKCQSSVRLLNLLFYCFIAPVWFYWLLPSIQWVKLFHVADHIRPDVSKFLRILLKIRESQPLPQPATRGRCMHGPAVFT